MKYGPYICIPKPGAKPLVLKCRYADHILSLLLPFYMQEWCCFLSYFLHFKAKYFIHTTHLNCKEMIIILIQYSVMTTPKFWGEALLQSSRPQLPRSPQRAGDWRGRGSERERTNDKTVGYILRQASKLLQGVRRLVLQLWELISLA